MTRKSRDKGTTGPEVSPSEVCTGCGGNCQDCEGTITQLKGSGRPRRFCCYNCRGRKSSRSYYRTHFKKRTTEEKRKDETRDRVRLIEGHKRAGHEGEPCPNPAMGDTTSCRVLSRLMDDLREEKGLNRMFEEMASE